MSTQYPFDSVRDSRAGSDRAFAAQSKHLQRTNSTASLRSQSPLLSRSPSKSSATSTISTATTVTTLDDNPDSLSRKWVPTHRTAASIDQIQRRFGGAALNRSSSITRQEGNRFSYDFSSSPSSPTPSYKSPPPPPEVTNLYSVSSLRARPSLIRERTKSSPQATTPLTPSGLVNASPTPQPKQLHHHHKSSGDLNIHYEDSSKFRPLRSVYSSDSPSLEQRNSSVFPKRSSVVVSGLPGSVMTTGTENTPPTSSLNLASPERQHQSSYGLGFRTPQSHNMSPKKPSRQGLRHISESHEPDVEDADIFKSNNIRSPAPATAPTPTPAPSTPIMTSSGLPSVSTPQRADSILRSPPRSRVLPKSPPFESPGSPWRNSAIAPDSPDISTDEVSGLPGRVKFTRRPTSTGSFAFNELRQMNLQREQLRVYEYLCHVGEAQQWVDDCLLKAGKSELVAPDGVTSQSIVDLEQNLRNGVILAHLARAFEGDHFVPRIFTSSKLEYRHIDNLNYFFRFLRVVGLPTTFHFETVDCYERKNMPKVFYCIHSLSYHLARQGRADPIQKLLGQLHFTDEQLAAAGRDIVGVNMPDFNNVGHDLAKELKVEPPPPPPEPVETEEEVMARRIREEEPTIRDMQSLARLRIARQNHDQIVRLMTNKKSRGAWTSLQSIARGMAIRKEHELETYSIDRQQYSISKLQSLIKGNLVRSQHELRMHMVYSEQDSILDVQTLARVALAQMKYSIMRQHLDYISPVISELQGLARRKLIRKDAMTVIRDLVSSKPVVATIQSLARAFIAKKDIHDQRFVLASHQSQRTFSGLQALSRVRLTHKAVKAQTKSFVDVSPNIIMLQSVAKKRLARDDFVGWSQHVRRYQPTILWIQCNLKRFICRKSYKDRIKHYEDRRHLIVKMQSAVRAKQQGEQYRQLRRGKNVPLSTIKNFIHLLDDSDYDYQQQIQVEDLKKQIVQKIRVNEELEAHVDDLDIKIALLVKNKITLDEVNRARRQGANFSSAGDLRRSILQANNDPFALENLDKATHARLEIYQELFYTLQTHPDYLAKLFYAIEKAPLDRSRSLSPEDVDKQRKDLEKIMMTMFGYCQHAREEFLLLKLLQRSLHQEMIEIKTVQDFIRSNFIYLRLFVKYGRGENESSYIRTYIGPAIEGILESQDLDLETDPLEVYKSSIENEERMTEIKSSRPRAVDPESALRDPETRTAFIQNLQRVIQATNVFLAGIFRTTKRMPFGIRYMVRETFRALKAKFPNEEEASLLKVAGHSLYYRFIHPVITNPDTYGLTKTNITPGHRKNLAEISKMLNQISVGRLFSEDHPYLQPLNEYVANATKKFSSWIYEVIDVDNAEDYFNADEFLDHSTTQRPTIYISPNEIYFVHGLIAEHLSAVAPAKYDGQDKLRTLLKELGGVPRKASEELNNARSGEITLVLKSRNPSLPDPRSEERALFVKTKRYIMALLKVEPGQDLLEVLQTRVTEKEEMKWGRIVEVEREKLRNETADDDVYNQSYGCIKATAIEGIMSLEAAGLVTRKNRLQDLLNAIAVDIRNKNQIRIRRENEHSNLQNTLYSLDKRKEYLVDQIAQYGSYIESSMTAMQKKGKKKHVIPLTPQYFQYRNLEKKGKLPKFGFYKYTAQKLYEKGVLLTIDDYANRDLYGQITITISSDEVGVFEFTVQHPGMLSSVSTKITMEELLQKQFNNDSTVEIRNIAKCNLNLLLHLINRKFNK